MNQFNLNYINNKLVIKYSKGLEIGNINSEFFNSVTLNLCDNNCNRWFTHFLLSELEERKEMIIQQFNNYLVFIIILDENYIKYSVCFPYDKDNIKCVKWYIFQQLAQSELYKNKYYPIFRGAIYQIARYHTKTKRNVQRYKHIFIINFVDNINGAILSSIVQDGKDSYKARFKYVILIFTTFDIIEKKEKKFKENLYSHLENLSDCGFHFK